jgi:hypothetical protein
VVPMAAEVGASSLLGAGSQADPVPGRWQAAAERSATGRSAVLRGVAGLVSSHVYILACLGVVEGSELRMTPNFWFWLRL